MSLTVVIHQPDFLPWLGFFHRLTKADLFIVLDHVQFARRGWIHRDRIKTPTGAQWISLSVTKAARDAPISEIRLSHDTAWRSDHLNLLRQNYRKADHFDDVFPDIEQLYQAPHEHLTSLNLAGIDLLCGLLDVSIPRVLSSELSPTGTSTAMLVDLLKKVGATRYLSGLGARDYLDDRLLADAGIELEWQAFSHPVYPQLHGEFLPMLSSVDLLLNCGARRSAEILRENQ